MIKFDVIFHLNATKIKPAHDLKLLNQRSKTNTKLFHPKPPFAFHDPICKTAMKDVTPGQMFWITKNGSPETGMAAHRKTLTDKQIWQIVAYIEFEFVQKSLPHTNPPQMPLR